MMLRNSYRQLLFAISPVALLAPAAAAQAQSNDTADDTREARAADSEARPNDIVVTAFKREETVQDVPVSISVITGKQLDEYGIRGFADYLDRVPGLTSDSRSAGEGSGPRAIGLRGIQSLNGTFSVGQNTVGFYIDDVPVPISNPRLVDLERVEVLRGPQGTLYGASSLNGTIKLVTRAPDPDRIEGTAMAGTSFTRWGGQSAEAEASLNLPLTSTLALRASGYYQHTAGYIDTIEIDPLGTPTGKVWKDANKVDAFGVRLAAGWTPAPGFEFRAAVMYTESDAPTNDLFTARSPGGTFTFDPLAGDPFYALGFTPVAIPELAGSRRNFNNPVKLARFLSGNDSNALLASLTARIELAKDVTLVSTGAYYRDTFNNSGDFTEPTGLIAFDGPFFDAGGNFLFPNRVPTTGINTSVLHNREWTSETRVQTDFSGVFNVTAGVFYSSRRERYDTAGFLGEGTYLYGAENPDGFSTITKGVRTRKELGLFGEAYLQLTDRLRVIGGLRYYDQTFKLADDFVGNPIFISGGASTNRARTNENGLLKSGKIEYRFDPRTMIYASAAEGFRNGGALFKKPDTPSCRAEIQDLLGTDQFPDSYKSDSLWSYEAGIRRTWFGGRVATNATLFAIDWKDTQVNIGFVCGLAGNILNVGRVRSRGGEFEVNAEISPEFSIGANVAHVDAEVREAFQAPGSPFPIAPAGSKLTAIPDWSGSVFWNIRPRVNGPVKPFMRGQLSMSASSPASFTTGGRIGGSTMLNLRLGATIDRWMLEFYATNLLNDQPSLIGTPSTFVFEGFRESDTSLRPRTLGVTLRTSFGG